MYPLSGDILRFLALFLDGSDLLALSFTSRQFYHTLVGSDTFWNLKLLHRGLEKQDGKSALVSYMKYQLRLLMEKLHCRSPPAKALFKPGTVEHREAATQQISAYLM